ncbi:ankyrin repeat domain-containing protein SOWAHC [Chironomus tepperi]|uniref:ankyrin repeat domain-containing protein SOWAHC n=1 Tax=Chironomus tepperi TaxID=113505 RepID=UPI00391F1830
MDEPSELSLREIHKYFVRNNYKVTNTQLVKYFRKFLTGSRVEEARKEFKTFVNILATIKNENNEKYLILRKKYYDEVPGDDMSSNMSFVSSSSIMSLPSEMIESPVKNLPPPYRAPPKIDLSSPSASPFHQPVPISMTTVGLPILEPQTKEQYKECVSEFQQVMSNFMDGSNKVDVASRKNSFEQIIEEQAPSLPPRKKVDNRSFSRENSIEKSFEINKDDNKENTQNPQTPSPNEEKGVSVKEAMLKFNRYAEAEEAKVPSPMSKLLKNKTEKVDDTTGSAESLTNHPKAKEWMISAARSNYQELAKLGQEHPQLVRLQDPNTTALHWASKHGNEDVVKLIAGTFRADVNCQTNGGYTSLHIAMQCGRNDIFELLCNVYKADRDILDWSGKKPLDYQKQLTSISAHTFSKIKSRKKVSEKDSFLRIGSLRIGNLLGHTKGHHNNHNFIQRSSMQPPSSLDIKVHKNYGSVDNVSLPHSTEMGPPKNSVKKRKQKREYNEHTMHQSQSMPTTPNLETRHKRGSDESDSDSAYGFNDNWAA